MGYYDHQSPEYKLIELAKNLKYSGCGVTDHIPFLENYIREQLADIKKKLVENEQVAIFAEFEAEFEERSKAEQLTYKYWILLGYRLSIFITPPQNRTKSAGDTPGMPDCHFHAKVLDNAAWRSYEAFESLFEEAAAHNHTGLHRTISHFPGLILLPSTLGDFPISLMSDLLIFNALPLGLISTDIIADGQRYYPDRFYRHDITHAEVWYHTNYCFCAKNTLAIFFEYMAEIINTEADNYKKSQLEFILFFIVHEVGFFIKSITDNCDSFDNYMESQRFIYELATNDRYYGPLIKPHLRKEFPESDESAKYIDEGIRMMRSIIAEFFTKYGITNFYLPIKIRRNYLADAPFMTFETGDHWSSVYDAELKVLLNNERYKEDDFYHFLVRKDKQGPHFSGLENTHFTELRAHLESMQEKFQYKKMKPQHQLSFFNNPEAHASTESSQQQAMMRVV